MASPALLSEIQKRRTFAIISHPDAGKTTLTEKLLLFGGAIQMAGTVKGRKADKHATSDWMAMEKERGISVTTAVMQFPYRDHVVNLLDTPGHADFSEDTYRTLTAVDCALMVIDAVKGVEARTIKLMEVCRLRNTPIITFINKLDRESRCPIELLDEVETVLGIKCAPITWPVGMGKGFKGVYDTRSQVVHHFQSGKGHTTQEPEVIQDLTDERLAPHAEDMLSELELVTGASDPFDEAAFLKGTQTPVFFGSAISNFGVQHILDALVDWAPAPGPRSTAERVVQPEEEKFSGFVFKIQANMDPKHRDRIAFMRVCSGVFEPTKRINHLRIKRQVTFNKALTFMANERAHVETAYPGDIIGLHNHGTIQIGDTFSEGEQFTFQGIPNFAPELFKSVRPKDPLKMKQLVKGLQQLSEEGATQVFKPMLNNEVILGAVGTLQFDVVAHRLQHEYNVECIYQATTVSTARWVTGPQAELEKFKNKLGIHVAEDAAGALTYLAPSGVHLTLTIERWPELAFHNTREHISH